MTTWVHRVLVAAALLAIYSDVLKWYARSEALALSYGALLFLVVLLINKNLLRDVPLTRAQYNLELGVIVVILAYAVRGGLSHEVELARVVVGFAYVALPLAFLLGLLRVAPFANIERFGTAFFFMMMPVHFVALVQFFVDSQFLVHTAYSEGGGIIIRNWLGGTFSRLPSVFASADRFASMATAHAYFALVLILLGRRKTSARQGLWLIGNLGLASAGVVIAGARSRVLLLGVLLIAAAAGRFIARKRGMRNRYVGFLFASSMIGVVVGIVGAPYLGLNDFPVVDFVIRSVVDGDFVNRVGNAFEYSRLRGGTTLLGSGLGTLSADGTPGEFGLRSLWIEMGLMFGTLVLAGFALTTLTLFQQAVAFARRGDQAMAVAVLYPALVLVGGILVGLKFSLELSSSIIVGIGIALAMSRAVQLRSRRSATRLSRFSANGRSTSPRSRRRPGLMGFRPHFGAKTG